MYLLLGFVSALIGIAPLVLARKIPAAILQGIITFFLGWGIFYLAASATFYPFFGSIGVVTLLWWFIAAIIVSCYEESYWVWLFPVAALVLYIFVAIANSAVFRAGDYASLINHLGPPVEETVWSKNIQPKDPAHMRMASRENALYQAQKVLGTAGAIGSQFEIGEMTVQMVRGELAFIAPLDFAGFSVWLNTNGVPGYIKVSGEDPHRQAEFVRFPKDRQMVFTPGAFFSFNLERHLRKNGYLGVGLTEYTFEIDDEGNPWWVITAFKPTLAWSAKKILGVVLVNPFTGATTFYKLGEVPGWVDRVVPSDFISDYLKWQGEYSGGWLNSWWGMKGLTAPDGEPLLIYGTGNQPEWVTDITSASTKDDSLIALVYTNSRTGKSVRYRMPGGGTTTAILDAVNKNQDIQFKHLHGAAVQIYNVNGQPTAVVPLLNESHSFQGVAMVSIGDVQAVATGRSAQEAVRNFEKVLTETGRRASVEGMSRALKSLDGIVSSVGTEVTPTQGTVYYLFLSGIPHLFTAGAGQSIKLPVTKEGHRVRIEFYDSDQDVIPMHNFDNLSVALAESRTQIRARAADKESLSTQDKEN